MKSWERRARLLCVVFAVWLQGLLMSNVRADIIAPVSASASGYYSWQQSPINLINNNGLDTSSGSVLNYQALADGNANGMWEASSDQGSGSGSAPVVSAQYVEFDLGQDYDLSSAYLWQLIQPNLLGRGVQSFTLYGSSGAPNAAGSSPSAAGNSFTQILSSSMLTEASGTVTPTQAFALTNASDIRTVYLQINSDWSNAASDYVGLSEIKFAGTPTANAAPLYTWNGGNSGNPFISGLNWNNGSTPDFFSGTSDFAFNQNSASSVSDLYSTWVRNLNVSAGNVALSLYAGTPSDYSIGYLQTNAINVTGGTLSITGDLVGGVNSQQSGLTTLGGALLSFNALNISGGGQVIDNSSPVSGYNSLIIGQTPGFSATATVSGSGSSLTAPALTLGDGTASNTSAAGSLWISGGASVTSNGIVYNGSFGGTGFISVDGNGSSLVVSSNNLLIGYGTGSGGAVGEGTLIITNGAQVTDAAAIQIGASGGKGYVVVGKSDGTDNGNSMLSAGSLTVTTSGTASGTLAVNHGGIVRVSGTLSAQASSGTITLAGGTVQANTITLDTASNLSWTNGTLWLGGGTFSNGSTSNTLTVPSGGILKGSGTISDRVTVDGTISPGDTSAATLATRNLAFARGGIFAADIDFADATADLLNVTGTVNLTNATLDLSLLNFSGSLASPETFLLIENDSTDSVSGTFASIDQAFGSDVQYSINYKFSGTALNGTGTGNDVAITLTAVPEPATLLPLLGGVGLLARRRRPAEDRHNSLRRDEPRH